MENSRAGVSKPTMPGGEIDLGQMEIGIGRRLRDRVKRSVTIGSMNHGSHQFVLYRETTRVKFNTAIIITSKVTDRNEIIEENLKLTEGRKSQLNEITQLKAENESLSEKVKSLNKELGILKSKEAVDKLLETTKHKGREGLGFDPSSSKRKGRTTFIPPKPTAKPNKQKGKEKEKPTEVPKKEAAKYPGVWYLDSGCSRHMTGDASLLSNLIPYDGPRVTFGGSNDFGLTKGLGNLVYKGLTIQAVSYVEGLNYNLLSISQFCDKGYSLEFCKDMASLKNISTNEVILTGKRIKNIYEVMWDNVKEACLISKGCGDWLPPLVKPVDQEVSASNSFLSWENESIKKPKAVEREFALLCTGPSLDLDEHSCSKCLFAMDTESLTSEFGLHALSSSIPALRADQSLTGLDKEDDTLLFKEHWEGAEADMGIITPSSSKMSLQLPKLAKGKATYSPSHMVTRSRAKMIAAGRKEHPIKGVDTSDEERESFVEGIRSAFKRSCPSIKTTDIQTCTPTPKCQVKLSKKQKKKAKMKLKQARAEEIAHLAVNGKNSLDTENFEEFEDDLDNLEFF
ncbi:unnamed protein product [Cuscuta campestris]|uniref:Retrovirus-related Pol polyprotein from transposon TNT 1-94-like beta-barrel domain-containing protein n=1 Tax=Cuscuta campestris TaxID=132261 RepID=A0A484NKS4_9ASTE|nr:unnamed protein product [Cuscuta campestris]